MVLNTVSLLTRAEVAHYEMGATEKSNHEVQEAQKGARSVFMGTDHKAVPVFDREKLGYGHVITGPALVESVHTTVYVSEGWRMAIDQYNNAVLEGI